MIPLKVGNYASRYFTILFEVDPTKDNRLILESILNDINDDIGKNLKVYFFKEMQKYNNTRYNASINIELSEINFLHSFANKVEKFKKNVDCEYINIKMIKLIEINHNKSDIYIIKDGFIDN